MDCDVCFLPFATSGPREPKVLECGHTFCSNCVGLLNNLCATCRQGFRTTKTNFILIQLLSGNADNVPSRNEQLPERSTAQIECEIEERKRELELRKRQELTNQLLSIKTVIELIQGEKTTIDNEVIEREIYLRNLKNEVSEREIYLQNLKKTSREKQTEIDRLNNDSVNLEKQLENPLRGNLAGGGSYAGIFRESGKMIIDRSSITKTCPICNVRTGGRDECMNHIHKRHPEYVIS